MQKYFLGFYFIVIVSFLAACISIPIGEDTLKISSDGVEFIEGDSNHNENNNNNDNGNNLVIDETNNINNDHENNVDNDNDGIDDEDNNDNNEIIDSDLPENNTDNADNEANSEDHSNNDSDNNASASVSPEGCEVQDHSLAYDEMGGEMYIPECAILTDVNKHDNTITVNYLLEGGEWDKVFTAYEEYIGKENISSGQRNLIKETSQIRGTMDNEAEVTLDIYQTDEGVEVRLYYTKPS